MKNALINIEGMRKVTGAKKTGVGNWNLLEIGLSDIGVVKFWLKPDGSVGESAGIVLDKAVEGKLITAYKAKYGVEATIWEDIVIETKVKPTAEVSDDAVVM